MVAGWKVRPDQQRDQFPDEDEEQFRSPVA